MRSYYQHPCSQFDIHNPSANAIRSPTKVIFNAQPNEFPTTRIPIKTTMTPIYEQKSDISHSRVSNSFHQHSYSFHNQSSPKINCQNNLTKNTQQSPTKLVQNSLQNSLIYELSDTNITNAGDSTMNRFSFSRTGPIFKTKQPNQYLTNNQKLHNQSSQLSYFSDRQQELSQFSQNSEQLTYSQLLLENMKLKNIIDNEYIPMKKDINRLMKDQEQRDYLVTQLQWKVKQLHQEILQAKNSRK